MTFFPTNLLDVIEETEHNTTKANVHPERENTATRNKHKTPKPGLIVE